MKSLSAGGRSDAQFWITLALGLNRVILDERPRLPEYPEQQTSAKRASWSVWCQLRVTPITLTVAGSFGPLRSTDIFRPVTSRLRFPIRHLFRSGIAAPLKAEHELAGPLAPI